MRIAISARIAGILGASLIALILPSIALATTSDSIVNGIDGSSVNGIDGSSTTGIDGSSTAGIDGSSIVLAGPVDSIDRINGVFMSMGQVVMASQGMLSRMQVGDYVSVAGSIISSGWLYADGINVSSQLYVPGSTQVFVAGILSSIDRMNGTAQMGGLTIDYTASLGRSNAPSQIFWSFLGTRPGTTGVMISDRSLGLR